MKPLLIGLTGPAGAGKDTAASYLCRRYGALSIALAAPIKEALNSMFGWTAAQWLDREWKEAVQDDLGFSPRHAAQTLGTEWGRSMKQDLWLKVAERRIERLHLAFDPRIIVITDVRFPNEADWLHANGGVLFNIEPHTPTATVRAHSSEAGLDPAVFFASLKNPYNDHDVLYSGIDQAVFYARQAGA